MKQDANQFTVLGVPVYGYGGSPPEDITERITLSAEATTARKAEVFAMLDKAEKEGITRNAIKHDSGKPPMSLLSRIALEEIAKVLEFGKHKYSAHNWRSGFAYSRLLDAMLRHITAYMDGEDKDPESGLSHMAHAGCCVMFMLEIEKTHPEMDDRYKKNASS